MESVWAILVAGGVSNRFGTQTPKQFLPLAGKYVIEHSIECFNSLTELAGIVLVLPEKFISEWCKRLSGESFARIRIVSGGLTRQKSVQNGLSKVDEDARWIIVHDVARPMVTRAMIERTVHAAKETGAAITAVPVADTLKKVECLDLVEKTVSRDKLYQVQTPQVFSKEMLHDVLRWAESKGLEVTDEASLVEQMGHKVKIVAGSVTNFKITREDDLELAEAYLNHQKGSMESSTLRIGEGYDVHAFAKDRDLILGGVHIPYEQGLAGHSDADALLHAICDALLGAVAAGDIGKHFPDNDSRYQGISSLLLLEEVGRLVKNRHFQISNIDATVICQRPKLADYILSMRENIARVLKLTLDQVSVKATTEEGLGFTGKMEGLAAKAVVLIAKR